jgi:hypothetical protein
MNKKRLTKQLDTIATNVAKKGIFIVTKSDDFFIVQEHITKRVVHRDLPMRGIAEYLCKMQNKGKSPNEHVKREIKQLVSQYFKLNNDMLFYQHTLKSTKDSTRWHATYARLHECRARFTFTKKELASFK